MNICLEIYIENLNGVSATTANFLFKASTFEILRINHFASNCEKIILRTLNLYHSFSLIYICLKKCDFKIHEMCFLWFYADINSLRLSKNLQYNMIKSLSKACNLNRPTCISTATVGLGLYINLSFYRLYYLYIEEKGITQYIALKKLRKSDADDRGPAYLSYFLFFSSLCE